MSERGIRGYTFIGDVQTGDYSWSAAGAWRQDATGRIYFATDGGCSCNNETGDRYGYISRVERRPS